MPAYKDQDGKSWSSSFYYNDWTGTRKKKFKRGFKTKEEALAFEEKFLRELASKSNIGFGKLVDLYLDDMKQRVRCTTFQTKQYIVRDKILPYFKDRDISEIEPGDIRRWQDDLMKRGYAETYLRTIHEQLSAIFNHAVRYYDLPKNPCLAAGTMGKGHAGEMEIWTLAEFNKFMDCMKERPICSMAFLILFWTGLRLGEMLALTVTDVDLEEKKIRVNKSLQRIHGYDVVTEPKTPRSNRVISIPQLLAVQLEEFMDKMGITAPDTRIIRVSRTVLGREFKRGIRKSGVKDIHIHCLRHSHTALIASLGATPVEAAERLGHENVKTTLDIYSHVLPWRQQAIADELDKFYEESQKKEDDEGEDTRK